VLPLLTLKLHEQLRTAVQSGARTIVCSLDLERTTTTVEVSGEAWLWNGRSFPHLDAVKDRTIYYWDGAGFQTAARFSSSLIKLVPTEWGAPTFEIDGIKMLPTSQVSPYEDARRKVALIQPRGKIILDTCGGLGYFAAWCLQGDASAVLSFERNADVIWLRTLNPWSPEGAGAADARLKLTQANVVEQLAPMQDQSVDAILHDPPRFGIAGELYSQSFYDELARVLKRRGRMFHYTGTPNKLTSGRDVPNEVATRLRRAGFRTELHGDGVVAVKS
jgi:predicted methyltransferase